MALSEYSTFSETLPLLNPPPPFPTDFVQTVLVAIHSRQDNYHRTSNMFAHFNIHHFSYLHPTHSLRAFYLSEIGS